MAEPSTTGMPRRLRAPHRHVARRVAQALLLLVRGVVLLVDHDEPQVAERHEHREARARARSAPRPTAPRASRRRARPRARWLWAATDARAGKALAHLGLELRREADLRNQQAAPGAPRAERVGDEVQVDLGLAAAGDALQQHRDGSGPRPRGTRRHGAALRGGERGRAGESSGCARRWPGRAIARRLTCRSAAAALAADHLAQRALVVARRRTRRARARRNRNGRHVRHHALDGAEAPGRGSLLAARVRPRRRPTLCVPGPKGTDNERSARRSPRGARKSKRSSSGTSRRDAER